MDRRTPGRGQPDEGGVAAARGLYGEVSRGAARARGTGDLHGHVGRAVALGEAAAGSGAGVARVLVAARVLAADAVVAVRLARGGLAAVGSLSGEGRAAVGRPEGEHGRGDDGGDDGRGDGARPQPVPAGGPVLGVHREASPVEARRAAPRPRDVLERDVQGGARGLQDGERGGRDRAGPGTGRGTFGGAAAARAVVDVPDEFAAQAGAQDQLAVAGEVGDARAGAGLDDGEGGAGAFDLTGGGREQLTRLGGVHAEDGGDLVGGELVADGEFERLPLLGGGAGGLRPGQQGEFALPLGPGLFGDGGGERLGRAPVGGFLAAPVALVGRTAAGGVRRLVSAPGLGELAQAGPAGERVQPGPAVVLGLRGALAPAVGEREDVAERGGGRVVVAQHGQAVGEQAVQIGLVARGRALGHRAGRCATGQGHPLRAAPCARCAPVVCVVCVEVSGLLLITRATVGARPRPLLPP